MNEKTIISGKNIEGRFYLIQGFSKPTIDPVATRKKVDPLLSETAVIKKLSSLSHDAFTQREKIKINSNKLVKASRAKNQKQINSVSASLRTEEIVLCNLENEIIGLRSEILKEKNRLVSENVKYCHPRAGEIIITEERAIELSEKIKQCKENEVLCIELSENRDSITREKIFKIPEPEPLPEPVPEKE